MGVRPMTTLAAAIPDDTPLVEDETRLIDRARHDPDAFGCLYRRHYRAIARYLIRRVGDEQTAEDLAGETFLAAWRAIARYRHTRAPFRAWLMRIATNEANRWARRARRANGVRPNAQPARTPEDRIADHELARHALLALSPAQQAVLTLRLVEELSVEETALVLGVRAGTVKSRLARARDAFRRELERRIEP